jgi:peptidoglycan hydrolase CwlO-like protein
MNTREQVCFALAAGLTLLSSSGCYLQSAGRELEQRMTLMEARQSELALTFEEERTRLDELMQRAEGQILEVQSALEDAQAFLQRNHADLGARVEDVVQLIADLEGRLEEAQFNSNQVRAEIELLRQEFQIQLQALGGR